MDAALDAHEFRAMAEEQASLRRVATLVARGATQQQVFSAVTEEIGTLLPVDFAILGRFEKDDTICSVAAWSAAGEPFPLGTRWPLDGKNTASIVHQTGRPVRIDDYGDATGAIGEEGRGRGFRSTAGAPIIVEGRVWGALAIGSTSEQTMMPTETEGQLVSFTELVASSIANAESRAELAQLVDEQAALRRVATVVAHGASPADVFAAVTQEVGELLPVEYATLWQYGPAGMATHIATWGTVDIPWQPGDQVAVGGNNLLTRVLESGRSAHMSTFADATDAFGAFLPSSIHARAASATPIVVDSNLWGAIVAGSVGSHQLPADTEARLADFTELVAAAIANTESRAELAQLVEEQAALRRVATAVAHGASPTDVFAAVTEEVGKLLPVEYATLWQYEPAGMATFIASWGAVSTSYQLRDRLRLGGKNLLTLVFETGRSARLDNYDDASGELGDDQTPSWRHSRSAVATPLIVEANLWGAFVAGSMGGRALPVGTEVRLADFTELVAAAIANTESRAELVASRARIAAAADETRRQIERDLHDGTQQQLVSLILELRAAQSATPAVDEVRAQLARAARGLDDVLEELREISRGIHPALLSKAGLNSALKALGRRAAIPVEFELQSDQRLPEPIEVAAYYVVSEALTNAVKHSRASVVTVKLEVRGGVLSLAIRDDGVGGADPRLGSGLVGLADRLEALGGRLAISSVPDHGTSLMVEVPLDRQRALVATDLRESV
jgi:signal transduction histidine kinase